MKGQGMAQKTVFSEGRTLCARVARPYSCHGISSADMGGRVAVGLMETRLGQAQVFLSGRAEPAPPRGASLGGRPYGGKPEDGAKGGFLGGTHSVRPFGKAGRKPREVVVRDELARGQWPSGAMRG